MYLSHPVRRIREDPDEDETVTLRVTAVDDDAADELVDRIDDVGVVEERLRFAGLRVTLPQERLDDICALEGIESIETGNTFSVDFDTPEDADYDSTCR
ncbi:hypothetical protein [Salinibaculum salinum]|uniref:hypothetical protein n=1 Tax=Salinibaculum salinum TaxID=3131996 RepID=UPI0030EEC91E